MRSRAANFVFMLLWSSAPAFAEPLTLEVTEAEVAYHTPSGQPVVNFRMSEASRKAFADFTAQHLNKKIDIRVGDTIVTQVVIREPITGGTGQILATSADAARQLTERLRAKAPLVVDAIP